MAKKLFALRGMKDILPKEQPYWDKLRHIVSKTAANFGYDRIDTPVLEFSEVFERAVGEGTDIVEKEMYTFTTKGRDKVTLRPELTASIARAFIEHGMSSLAKPVKLYSTGPLFRYERPQEGRYREHHQISFEAFGSADAILDAQVILAAFTIITKAGVKNPKLLLNSIGCNKCRKPYIKGLVKYLKSNNRKICADCRRRLKNNPLRVLDCKQEKCQEVVKGAPQLINSLCEDCHSHFKQLLEYLDQLNMEYFIEPNLVRGLDYYNRTVFEFSSRSEGARAGYSYAGGGRYDSLIKTMGGKDTPGIGFGIGMERLVLEMKDSDPALLERVNSQKSIFMVQLGEMGKKKSLEIYYNLQKTGLPIAESFGKGSIKSQLKAADRKKASIALIIGQKEALDETVIVRDMEVGSQEIIPQEKLIPHIKKIMAKKK